MKNKSRVGYFIGLGVLTLIGLLVFLFIPNKLQQIGCKYDLRKDMIYLIRADTTYTDENGWTERGAMITYHTKDSVCAEEYARIEGYEYLRYYRNDSVVKCPKIADSKVIFKFVVEVKWGSRSNPFMLVAQKPEDDVSAASGKVYYRSHEKWMKIVKDYPYFKYWIIKFDTDDVYGPFTEEEYLLKRKELGVGEELKLLFEEKAK